MIELYCDGATIGRNPSRAGGTWAYVVVQNGETCVEASGKIVPEDINLPAVTNNVAELYAAMMGMEYLVGEKVRGCSICTDSLCTVCRLVHQRSWKGVPERIVERVKKAIKAFDAVRVVQVAGHPTPAEIRVGHRNGVPCSKFNERCDELCYLCDRWSRDAFIIRRGIEEEGPSVSSMSIGERLQREKAIAAKVAIEEQREIERQKRRDKNRWWEMPPFKGRV